MKALLIRALKASISIAGMSGLELLLLGFFRPPGTRLLYCNVVYTCLQQQIVMLLYVAGLNLVMIPLLIIYVVKGGDTDGTQESP